MKSFQINQRSHPYMPSKEKKRQRKKEEAILYRKIISERFSAVPLNLQIDPIFNKACQLKRKRKRNDEQGYQKRYK